MHSVRKMRAVAIDGVVWSVCVSVCWSRTWALQKRLSQWRCRLGGCLTWNNVLHQWLASLALTYLTTDIHLVSEYGRRPLRSSCDRTQTVIRTHDRFGDRSFAVAGPRLWNSLPISLRQIASFGQFRRYLKNHLFGIWEITAQCDAWFSALYKYCYLLTCMGPRSDESICICEWWQVGDVAFCQITVDTCCIVFLLQYVIRAPRDGCIKHVPHQVGQTVQKGMPLILLEDE